MGGRKKTQGDTPDWGLTPQQCTAVDLLVSGKTLSQTAEALGVGRPAVSDWVNHHPGFQAALTHRRQELWDGMVDTLRGLLPKALAVLATELDGPTPLPAAIQVLKSCGLAQGLGRPTGPTTVEDAEQAQRQREIARVHATLTEEDVQLAQQRRDSDRRFAALTALAF
jgi:hypothetical protein